MRLIVTVPHGTFVLEQKGPFTWRTDDASTCLTKVNTYWQLDQRVVFPDSRGAPALCSCAQRLHETWRDRGKGPCMTREPSFDRYGFLVTYLNVKAEAV